MIFTLQIQKAIRFSIKTHEGYQKQKRKGKDIPYITHPLTVGLILAHAGVHEDVVVAAILHDTIEDSIPEKKVTGLMLRERFGEHVAMLVESVTEDFAHTTWEEQKAAALEHITHFSHEAVLVKSGDIIANATETILDYTKDGDAIFARFGASKEKFLEHYLNVITALRKRFPENPLDHDLEVVAENLRTIQKGGQISFTS